jgi:site-specific recombinase XerD
MKSREVKKVRGVFEKVSGSGIWWIQYFDTDGRRRREKVGTRGNAIDLVRKRKNEALAGKKLPEKLRARAVTFQQLADAALEYSRTEKGSYQHDIYRMAPMSAHFGQRTAESILPEEFEGWLNDQAEKREWSVATKNRYTALLKLTYRLAEKNRKVKVNPARLLRMPKEDNATVRYLNQYKPLPTKVQYLKGCETEEDRLRAAIRTDYPNHLLEFEIALATGMRRSEMYRSTWPNVDLEHNILTVPRSKHGETRHVTLNSAAKTMLEFLREKGSGSEYVFLSMRNNEPLTGNRHWFEDAVKKAGVKNFTWHCLRHTFGSRLASRGIDLRKIQELMGHKTLAVTVRYTHLSQPDLRAAVEQLVSSGKPTATTSATGEQELSGGNSTNPHQIIGIQ